MTRFRAPERMPAVILVFACLAACGGSVVAAPDKQRDAGSSADAEPKSDAGHDSATDTDAGGPTHPSGKGNGSTVEYCGAFAANGQTLVAGQQGIDYFAVDGTHAYWAESHVDIGQLWRVPKYGGEPTPIGPAGAAAVASGIAVDADTLYWAIYGDDGRILKAPKGGGTPVVVANGQHRVTDLLADGGDLFWLAEGSMLSDYIDGQVMTLRQGDTVAKALAADQSNVISLTLSAEHIYWAERFPPGNPVTKSVIRRVARAGGSPGVVAECNGLRGVGVDDDTVYYADEHGLWRKPQAGGVATPVAAGDFRAIRIVPWGGCVYFNDYGTFRRVSKQGGEPVTLGGGFPPAVGGSWLAMGVDDGAVYWVEDNALWRVPRL